MLDAVVIVEAEGPHRTEMAARSLAALVEGVVEGALARVVLLTAGEAGDLPALADAAGCRLESDVEPARTAAALARHCDQPHVLLLAAGTILPTGWPELARQAQLADGAAAFLPDRAGERWRLRALALTGRPLRVTHGILADRVDVLAFTGGSLKLRGRPHLLSAVSSRWRPRP